MPYRYFRWSLTVLALWNAQAFSSERFAVEFSKSIIYVGESVQANFVLHAREDALDVEVARFPQFRGFWSENMALRQGPMPLLRESFQSDLRRAVIGTYVITPMQGRSEHVIEPMKILVKQLFGNPGMNAMALPFESERTPLEIKPLPPTPGQWSPTDRANWKGLVGTVSLRADTVSARFFTGEPTTVRYSIQGEANFAELRELPIAAPPEVSILDQRVNLFGGGTLATKIFEITIVPRTEKDVLLPPLRLPVFDPSTGSYDILTTEAVQLVREPKPLFAQGAVPTEGIPKEKSWRLARPAWRSPLFLGFQLALLALLATLSVLEVRRRRIAVRDANPAYQRQQALRRALACLAEGDRDGFFREATPVAQATATESARRFLAQREAMLFAPPASRQAADDGELRVLLQQLVQQLATEDPSLD